jgi:hypothetical protein
MIGECCLIKKLYSSWHGHKATIQFIPNYGVIAPSWLTNNGCASLIRKYIDDPDELQLFNEFVEMIVVG